MTPEERKFLRDFFQAVTDQPLDPADSRYVPLYTEPTQDPVELLARAIEWTPGESVQLLSGFRGTGKSTELRRLRKRLKEAGYIVVLCDIEDYLNLSTSVDISDFLMAVAGAFGDALWNEKLVVQDATHESYWNRLTNFLLNTKVEFPEVTGKISAIELKANLKSAPTFRQRLQERMAGHVGALVNDVRLYVEDCFKRVRVQAPDAEVVLLLDSIEHIRGTSVNAQEVQASVETLFAGHSDKLRLPYLHVVYTVPPYLKVRYPGVGALYEPGGLQVLPALKLRNEADGSVHQAGVDSMERVVRARGNWERLLRDRAALDELVLSSGGHLRDLLRLLAEILRRTDRLPAVRETVEAAINQIKMELLPIAKADALWLARIEKTHQASLEDVSRLPDLARFLDTHLVLCYRDGPEWYNVHPLVVDEVKRQVPEGEPEQRSLFSAAEVKASSG